MFAQKKGFPQESDLVLCTVTNVQGHSVFVRIEEFGISGMIHISEVAPGRIRNIRDYVKEGKLVVCKVLRINRERGHVDLSLRRVTESQRRSKIASIKQQQKADKIIEFVSKKIGMEPAKAIAEVSEKLLREYDSVFEGFQDVVENNASLSKLGVSQKLADELEATIKARMKPEIVEISGTLHLMSTASDGVERVKKALLSAKQTGVDIRYLGAGNYLLHTKASEYKAAEELLRSAGEKSIEAMKKLGGEGDYKRKAA